MASLAIRMKYLICGHKRLSQIIPTIVMLAVTYFVIRWANSSPPQGMVWEDTNEDSVKFTKLDDNEIQTFINSMQDTRQEFCKLSNYERISAEDTVSIIVEFNEKQFYDLKSTLTSIVQNTPSHLYKEIILLDDGTSSGAIRSEAVSFLHDSKFKKVKPYRSEKFEGSALARFKASKVVDGSILVFLHSKVVVNKGWLEPLINAIKGNRRQIVVPHFDTFLTGQRFFHTPDNLVNVFTWTLNTVFMEAKLESDHEFLIPSPAMTGTAFAVDTNFFEKIGNYDDGFIQGGGENLELSIRSWLCGGGVYVVPCSRVAMKNALHPHQVSSPVNFRRITELWLSDQKETLHMQSNVPYEMEEEEMDGLKTRKIYMKKVLNIDCKDLNWYLDNVGTMIHKPSSEMREFGKLKSKTGYCLVYDKKDTDFVTMKMCRPHIYEDDTLVEITKQGAIKSNNECLEASPSNIKWSSCHGKPTQQWGKRGNGLITSLDSGDMCLQHNRSPAGQHYVTLATCEHTEIDRSLIWEIIRF